MKAFWILLFATFSFAIFVVEASEDKNQQLKKWKHWNQVKRPVPEQSKNCFDRSHCREPIKTVFHAVFDQNKDGILTNSELEEVYEIANEAPCIKQFFQNCSRGKETFTEAEFCNCFSSVEPPCAHNLRTKLPFLLVRGVARGITGFYYPSCDQDGFYMPRQCRVTDNQGTKECWCVDRHGRKIEGMKECVDNTEPPAEEEEPAN